MTLILNDIFTEEQTKMIYESKLLNDFLKTQSYHTTFEVLECNFGICKGIMDSMIISRLNSHRDGNDYILLKSKDNLQNIEIFIGN